MHFKINISTCLHLSSLLLLKPTCSPLTNFKYILHVRSCRTKYRIGKVQDTHKHRDIMWTVSEMRLLGITCVHVPLHCIFEACENSIPELLAALLSCATVRQVAALGRVESVIFRYCSLATLRITFRSLTGTEVEPKASSFCPAHKQTLLCILATFGFVVSDWETNSFFD